MKLGINNYASIEIDKEYFSKNCKMNLIDDSQDKTCYLYIYVIQSRMSMKYHRIYNKCKKFFEYWYYIT